MNPLLGRHQILICEKEINTMKKLKETDSVIEALDRVLHDLDNLYQDLRVIREFLAINPDN